MSIDSDLGALICMLNPYTYGKQDAMDPHVFVPANYTALAAAHNPASPAAGGAPAAPSSGAVPAPAPGTSPSSPPDMTGVWIEEDKQHPHWEFKQQPHRIAKAVRIAYRWPYTVGAQTVWITDYVLVGFEGSNGDG